jgi:hypothetical protein
MSKMAKRNWGKTAGGKDVSLILVAVAVLLFVGFLYPSFGTVGQSHYTATIPVSITYSLNPIDISSGKVGIYTGTVVTKETNEAICIPNFEFPSIPNIFPSVPPVLPSIQGEVSVKTTGLVSKTVNLGAFSVDALTRFDKPAEIHCLVAGQYTGQVVVRKTSSVTQIQDFGFKVP